LAFLILERQVIFNRWTENIFTEDYNAIINSYYNLKSFKKEGISYQIKLLEFGNQDKVFSLINKNLFEKDPDGCVIVCVNTDCYSLEE